MTKDMNKLHAAVRRHRSAVHGYQAARDSYARTMDDVFAKALAFALVKFRESEDALVELANEGGAWNGD